MATVPQYERQVAPKNTPMPYHNLHINGDMFGENIYKAQANLGASLGNVADALDKIQTRIDDTKLVELANKSAEWEQINLYDTQNGYLYKTGKDAYGMSEDLMKQYDKYMNDYISSIKLRPDALRKANATITNFRGRINETVTSHDYKQGVNWSNTEAETGKNNYINNAINMRNNPEEINKSLISGFQLIEWQGEIQHKDEAAILADKLKYRSDLHQAVLSSLIADGSLKAGEYLEQHKREIDPNRLPQYINAIKDNEATYSARNIAASLIGMPLENAYSQMNSIEDEKLRKAVMQEYNLRTNQIEAVQREKNSQFMSDISNKLADALAYGNDPNDLKKAIMQSDLPFEVKQKQIGFINDCIELNQEVNLWSDKEALDEMMLTDFEAFQKEDLSKYALTKSEREKFKQAQNKVVEYSTEAQLKDIVKEFDTFFWGKDAPSSKDYKNELIGLLARIERLQGKAFNIKNIDKTQLDAIIKGFGYKDLSVQDHSIDETKEIYMRGKTIADVREKVARSYVNFKSKNKREPEPNEMYAMVHEVYSAAKREEHNRKAKTLDDEIKLRNSINLSTIKKSGYTKILTYFEEKTIPNLEKETGVKMNITSTYRSTGKYGHEKGLKADVFPANPTKENIIKAAEYLLASPDVEVVFTSNPIVLQRFVGHPKLQNATSYDNKPEVKKAGINHITHFDIKLSSKFGGTEQIKPAVISSAAPKIAARK